MKLEYKSNKCHVSKLIQSSSTSQSQMRTISRYTLVSITPFMRDNSHQTVYTNRVISTVKANKKDREDFRKASMLIQKQLDE